MTINLDKVADELSNLAESGVKKARAKGAEEAEVFISNINTINITLKTSVIEAREGTSLGLGIRVVSDGKVGFAATSGISETRINDTIEEALDVAKIRPLDPRFTHLPDRLSIPSEDGVIDDKILGFSETQALEEVNDLAKTAFEYDKRVKGLYGGVGVQKGAFAVSNSRGITGCSKRAMIGGGAYLTAIENGKRKTGSEDIDSRELVDFRRVGSEAAQRAIRMLKSKRLGKSFLTTVVWENISISPLLKWMFNSASSARNVQEGKSFFKGKLGEKVASNIFTIIDDGQLPDGLLTFKLDSEGIPSQTTTLIQNGLLENYLYDSYSALQENKSSTGNAGRQWPEPFLYTPNVTTSNLVVKTGRKDLEGLINEVDEGVLVTDFVMGSGHANMTTGEFSVVAPSAFMIENGEVKFPLEPITIAGNFFHSLKNIVKAGSDSRITSVGKIPSLTIENLTVSG
jgi:PmbA protein